MEFLTLTIEDFQKDVLESKKLVCLVFGADWSGSFYLVQPALDRFRGMTNGFTDIKLLDFDSNKWLAESNGINFHVPSILVYVNGEKVEQAVGLMSCLDLLIKLQDRPIENFFKRGVI